MVLVFSCFPHYEVPKHVGEFDLQQGCGIGLKVRISLTKPKDTPGSHLPMLLSIHSSDDMLAVSLPKGRAEGGGAWSTRLIQSNPLKGTCDGIGHRSWQESASTRKAGKLGQSNMS